MISIPRVKFPPISNLGSINDQFENQTSDSVDFLESSEFYVDNAEDNIIESEVRRASLDGTSGSLICGDDGGQLFIDENRSPEKEGPYVAVYGEKSQMDAFVVRSLLSRPVIPESEKKADEEAAKKKLSDKEFIEPLLEICIRNTYVRCIEKDLYWQRGMPNANPDWYMNREIPSPFLYFSED